MKDTLDTKVIKDLQEELIRLDARHNYNPDDVYLLNIDEGISSTRFIFTSVKHYMNLKLSIKNLQEENVRLKKAKEGHEGE